LSSAATLRLNLLPLRLAIIGVRQPPASHLRLRPRQGNDQTHVPVPVELGQVLLAGDGVRGRVGVIDREELQATLPSLPVAVPQALRREGRRRAGGLVDRGTTPHDTR